MVHTVSQPPPRDLSHHFSAITKRREASAIKDLYKYFMIPGIANLAGGLPNASYFPYDTLEATVAHPHRFTPSTPNATTATGTTPSSNRVLIPKESTTPNLQKKIDLTTALQYGTADGLPPMAAFVRQFTRHHLHPNVPYARGPDTLLTCGSTDGFCKAIEAFTNPWDPDRDWTAQREGLLCEEFVYMNAIATAQPRGLNVVPVAMDAQGMLARGKGGLADILRNWDFNRGKRPHLMYTITIGQNPTGGTLSVERRREIYALAQQYDIIIVEDDPYWNLQFPSATELSAQYRGTSASTPTQKQPRNYNAHGRSSGYEFLDSLVPSYLSIDTDGRVLRLDTFSKTIAPGCRLGWVTGQPAVIERIARITETSTQAPSGFVQAMVAELILGQGQGSSSDDEKTTKRTKKGTGPVDEGWQMDGWVRWLEGLRGGYERRMQDMCRVLEEAKFLVDPDGISDCETESDESNYGEDAWEVVERRQMYDFSWPTAGMFVWVKICLETHPLYGKYSSERLSQALWMHLTKKPYLALLGPGTMFAPTKAVAEKAWQYYRLCFAAMPAEEVTGVTERTVEGFRSFWQRTDLEGLEGEDTMYAVQSLRLQSGNLLGTGC